MRERSTNWLDAADPLRSVWVSANAGAGKTHTLANRVTRLLLNAVKPEKILCLTFTKAAAAEMQHRLFKQLGEWSMLDDVKLREEIAKIGGAVPDKKGLAKARRLFAQALETPGGLKIQTLHGFCERLLTRFPLEADVPPSFRVLDDQTSRELIAEARAEVLERAGRGDEHLAQAVALLATHSGETTVGEMLKVAMGADRGKLDTFVANKQPEEIVQSVAAAHGISPEDSYESIASGFCAEMKREEAKLKEFIAWLSGGTKTDIEAAERLGALMTNAYAPAYLDTFLLSLLTKEGGGRTRIATKKLETSHPHLFQELAALQGRMRETRQRCMAAHAAALAQSAITLACAARAVYTRAKKIRGVLDYSDLIVESVNLIERGNAAAWVLYKLDQGIDHILIDEAQDTSPEQWRIVRKLSEEFFVGEGARDVVRTVFAVGDEKQSIFSFQGADPDEFGRNRQIFRALTAQNGVVLEEVDLVTSRRSTREVLEFVDKVFEGAARAGVTSDDQPIRHLPHRDKAKGRVEFWPVTEPVDAEETDYWMLPLDVERPDSPVRRLAGEIAQRIRKWCDGKTKLSGLEIPVKPEDDRAIRPGDIMILTPRREPFASEVIRHLKELGVPVAGADRIRLAQQIGVMDLIALGRFALLPEDDLNLASLLRSPLVGFSDQQLYDLAQPREGRRLWRELVDRREENEAFKTAHDLLAHTLSRADYAPPHEFYAHALGSQRGRERLLARLGPEAADAIDEVLSLALEYEQLNVPSLEGFLHWIERGEAEIKRDMDRGRNEVRVMTVHGAKGLEAPIVILPDTARAPPTTQSRLIFANGGVFYSVNDSEAPDVIGAAKEARKQAALREHRRLLYVALTRARDRLYVCGFKGEQKLNADSWYSHMLEAAQSLGIETDGVRVIGEVDTQAFDAKASEDARKIALPAWATQDAPLERLKPRLIRASDAAGMEEPAMLSPLDEKCAKRFQRGNLIHGLLARLPDIAPGQRHETALRYLRANKVDDAEAEKLADETLAVIADKQFAAAFAPGSRAEVALVADLPEIGDGARLNGRIDRLAITDDEVLIVDFKTNRPPPDRPENVATVYKAQMALYKAALSKVFPGRRIACALVWTDGPSLMRLPDAMLEAEIGAIRARLDSGAANTRY